MNKTLIFVVLCGLGTLYFIPVVSNLLPPTILEAMYSVPRTWYAGLGLLIGVVIGSVFKEPSESTEPKPEKKLHLKKRDEPDEQLEALKRQFTQETPLPLKVEPVVQPEIKFDLDREYKLAIIKIANMNGAPAAVESVKEEVDPHADH